MRYEFQQQGDIISVDTRDLDYELIWDKLNLNKKQKGGAQKIIELYNSATFNDGILLVTALSWMKPYNREAQRHQADHYRTRSELEKSAGDVEIVTRLIDSEIMEIHSRWMPHLIIRGERVNRVIIGHECKKHPQAPYRLNISEIARSAELL